MNSLFANIAKYPQLTLGTKRGVIDHIDFIKVEDMNHPVMGGKDIYSREFLAIKLNIYYPATRVNRKIVCTFFQRYGYSKDIWAYGCYYASAKHYLYTGERIEHDDTVLYTRIAHLLAGGELYEYDKNNYLGKGDKVVLTIAK